MLELLRQAIQAARNGQELTARDLFQEVVRIDPENEAAWMWLSGLLDPLEDRILACERVLSINSENQRVRSYLNQLLIEQDAFWQKNLLEVDGELEDVRRLIDKGDRGEALLMVQDILRRGAEHKGAWLIFADLSANIKDKVHAYEKIVHIDPSDDEARKTLKQYKYYQRQPLELAAYYEDEGKLEDALELYRFLALGAGRSSDFDQIYKNIVRLEDAKIEQVQHVRPSVTIMRLSAGLPLFYMLEVLMQEGLNPLRHPAPDLWIGIPMVMFGSFLISVAGTPSRHTIWRKWFGEKNERGSVSTRIFVAVAGWILVLTPHLLLVLNSVIRLQTFQVPKPPFQ